MARAVVFEPSAWEDFAHWLSEDMKIVKRISALLQETRRYPFKGIGKPEPMKHDKQGYWSRRIDKANRLVYKVTDGTIVVISCRYHYKND
ncbi:MAG: Txe/YoeB family addiction module toxin [Defluviitaleaceae bacterium]|nr:Txe/YoeB family addiction module toxin [Defluviitaleaceae bacterium]